jgi:ribonucleotide monophosphatase NagD (HAD superfamily)
MLGLQIVFTLIHLPDVLYRYGFTNLVCLEDLLVDRPLLVPWKKYSSTYSDPQPTKPTTTPDPIRAIFMLHEPVDWAEGLQVLSDVLQSNGIITADDFEPSEEQVVSMYIANPDWSYAAQFHKPRYTAGAFTKCLATLFEGSTGRKLKTTVFGKPFAEMHSYAETTLEALHGSPLNRVYMIGDNPKSGSLRAQMTLKNTI